MGGKPTKDCLYVPLPSLKKPRLGHRGKDIRARIEIPAVAINSPNQKWAYNGKDKPDLTKESRYSINGTVCSAFRYKKLRNNNANYLCKDFSQYPGLSLH